MTIMVAPISRHRSWCPAPAGTSGQRGRSHLPSMVMGGLELVGQDMVLGEEPAARWRPRFERRPPSTSCVEPHSGRTDVHRTAVQHLDRDAVPPHAGGRARLRAGRAGRMGLPPGLIMIDDRWSVDYGNWTFDRTRFPTSGRDDATAPRTRLLGDGVAGALREPGQRELTDGCEQGLADQGPGWTSRWCARWWNGYSTVLDLTHPDAVGWLRGALRELMASDGVDGFKFDAGDLPALSGPDDVTMAGDGAVDQCEAWARLATRVQLQRAASLLEDGRPAARAAVARQATDLGPLADWPH